jgi:hypothetical protein
MRGLPGVHEGSPAAVRPPLPVDSTHGVHELYIQPLTLSHLRVPLLLSTLMHVRLSTLVHPLAGRRSDPPAAGSPSGCSGGEIEAHQTAEGSG